MPKHVTNRLRSEGVVTNVTSDGQGHYVVFHQAQAPPPVVEQQLSQQQRLVPSASTQIVSPTIFPSATTSRPRILTRPGTTVSTPFGFSPSTTVTKSNSNPIAPISIGTSSVGSSQQSPEVVTILDDEMDTSNVSTVSCMEQSDATVSMYDSGPTTSDTILAPTNMNYTTLTSIDNYPVSNITYMVEALPSNLDPSAGTVVMGSDNQLYNIQNNGEAILLCPSSGDHSSGNLMPLIDPSSTGTTSGQLHFPIGDVMSGNGVFELIALPSDSTITSFTDQPILNLANATNFGTMIPISSQQQDPNTQYVCIQDENGIATMASVGSVLHQNPTPLSVIDNSSVLTFTVPTSAVTTMAPSVASEATETVTVSTPKPKSQRAYITVVDDFSDLIKTEGGEMARDAWDFSNREGQPDGRETDGRWNFGSDGIDQAGLSFGMDNPDGTSDSEDSSCGFETNEDTKEDIIEVEPEEMTGLSIDMTEEVVNSGVYEQLQAAFNGTGDLHVKEEHAVRVMVDGEYFEEVKPTTDTVTITGPTNVEYKLDAAAVSQLTPITIRNSRPPKLKIGTVPKGSLQIRARPLPVLAKKPSVEPSSTIAKTLNDFTTITLRNTMEKASIDIPPAPILIEKPKPKAPPPIPVINRPSRHPGIPTVDWNDGVGRFPGLSGKICVDEATGLLEVIDYNPAEHQRRIRVPLKAVKEQQKVVRKIGYNTKHKLLKPLKSSTPILKSDGTKIKAKTVVPGTEPIFGGDKGDKFKHGSANDQLIDVTFCVTCGTLAKKEKEFTGTKCKNCFDSDWKKSGDLEDEESPATKFKIPKGITIVKTSSPLYSTTIASNKPSDMKLKRLQKIKLDPNEAGDDKAHLLDKKNMPPLLKLEPPLDSVGITVTPIFQTKVEVDSDEESESESSSKKDLSPNPKRRKYRKRSLVEQKTVKPKKEKPPAKKRTLESVLTTKTLHAKKSLIGGSGSSISDEKSPGAPELTDEDKANLESKSNAEPKKLATLIDFNWTKYLQETNSKGAPPRFFRQPAFPPANPFKIGMMLEAVDPQHQSLFCVSSVADVQGYRIRLRLTGYSESFDFWVNADCYDIFPAGWCAENNQILQPPAAYENFTWEKYLAEENAVAANPEFFAISKEPIVPPQDIQVGMKLEAVDIRNMDLTCVATVQNIINDRILIHFDSWDCIYDYWTDTSSPFIHHVGYCKKMDIELTPPKNHKGPFQWEAYLKETKSTPVPAQAFHPLPPIGFKKGMKLECVDKRNPFLIRVTTIAGVEDHQLTIHFDGWSSDYDVEVYECSPDIHPPGWCSATGHALQVPPDESEPWSGSCSIFGCLGVGHIKGYMFMTHNYDFNCPYSPSNLKKDFTELLPDRFLSYKKSVIVKHQHETSNASRRGSMEGQTTFQRAAKLRSEKRKALEKEIPVTPAKRKYTKRKSEPETLKTAKQASSSEGEEPHDKDNSQTGSLLLRRLSSRRSTSKQSPASTPSSSSSSSSATKIATTPVTSSANVVPPSEMPKRLVLPNIESTITPLPPPTTLPGGATVQVHWEEMIESMVKKDEVKKPFGESMFETMSSEYTLPASTTMTPIPTPTTSSSSSTTTNVPPPLEIGQSKPSADQLLMICSQKAGGELTISQCSNESANSGKGSEESEVPFNYNHNVKVLKSIVGKLLPAVVSKWRTKNVVGFVRKIPGCLRAAQKFDEHQIDGEAFLLMTMTDFIEVLGLKMGPSIKLFQAVRLVHLNSVPPTLPAVSITPIATP